MLDQGRQSLPFLKSYAKAGYNVAVVCNNRLNECYFSRYPSKKLLWPSYVKEREAFEKELINYLKKNKVDITISVGDISSDILSKNKEVISRYTNITLPDYPTFIKGADKLSLMKYCMSNNLPCPATYELNEETLRNAKELLKFPVMVKPTRGVGAIGVVKINDWEELNQKYKPLNSKFDKLIVQEFIPQEGGMQYQAEAFLDKNHELKVCMVISKPRFFPVNGGTSTANVSIEHPEIYETTKRLLEGLKWQGAADVDYILDPRDQKAKILEINPRVTAGIKIGFAAGIDYADLHVRLALGEHIPKIKEYKLGIYCRNFILETLWFLFSNNKIKRNTQPGFFKFPNRHMIDQVFSWDDPFTSLGFCLNIMNKYLSINKLKSKLHL